MERSCTKCGESKPVSAFVRNGTHPDGSPRARSICKACGGRILGKQTTPHRCSVCKIVKKPKEFPGTKRTYRCKTCTNQNTYATRSDNSRRAGVAHMLEYQKEKYTNDADFRLKRAAHGAVERALAAGKLTKPSQCSRCKGRPARIEAHHHKGYEKEHQLDVEWLCKPCHHRADETTRRFYERRRQWNDQARSGARQ